MPPLVHILKSVEEWEEQNDAPSNKSTCFPYLCIVSFNVWSFESKCKPIGSMYGIYANIWGILMVNVTIYSIHGSYGKGYVHCIFNRTKQYAVSMVFLFAASFWVCFCYRCWCCCCLLSLRLDVAPKQPPVVPKLRALFAFKVLNSIQGCSWISLHMVSKSFGADYSGGVPQKTDNQNLLDRVDLLGMGSWIRGWQYAYKIL